MPGAKLEVRLEPPDASPMTFRPAVLTVKTGRELRWIGRVVVPRVLGTSARKPPFSA